MSNIIKNIEELVGHTPLFEFVKYQEKNNIEAHLLGKLEYFNPSGSIKDRAALNMIKAAEEKGILHPGDTIVENTSGNTGIGLAAFSASRGYKLTVFLEPGQSEERQKMLEAYGAELKSMFDVTGVPEAFANGTFSTGFYQEAIQRYCDAQPTPHYFINQLANEANPGVHYTTTGPEIWEDTDGQVDVFIAGVGTGGTLTGVSRYIKGTKGKTDLISVAVEPTDSPVIAQALAGEEIKPGPHKIQGIGAGFIPANLDLKLVDKVIGITNEEAISTASRLMEEEGILAGISSGAAVAAALKLQEDESFTNKNIVVILPSSGERYLSTALFADLFTEKELQQ